MSNTSKSDNNSIIDLSLSDDENECDNKRQRIESKKNSPAVINPPAAAVVNQDSQKDDDDKMEDFNDAPDSPDDHVNPESDDERESRDDDSQSSSEDDKANELFDKIMDDDEAVCDDACDEIFHGESSTYGPEVIGMLRAEIIRQTKKIKQLETEDATKQNKINNLLYEAAGLKSEIMGFQKRLADKEKVIRKLRGIEDEDDSIVATPSASSDSKKRKRPTPIARPIARSIVQGSSSKSAAPETPGSMVDGAPSLVPATPETPAEPVVAGASSSSSVPHAASEIPAAVVAGASSSSPAASEVLTQETYVPGDEKNFDDVETESDKDDDEGSVIDESEAVW